MILKRHIVSPNPHIRQAACIWLLSLVKKLSTHKEIKVGRKSLSPFPSLHFVFVLCCRRASVLLSSCLSPTFPFLLLCPGFVLEMQHLEGWEIIMWHFMNRILANCSNVIGWNFFYRVAADSQCPWNTEEFKFTEWWKFVLYWKMVCIWRVSSFPPPPPPLNGGIISLWAWLDTTISDGRFVQ